MVFVLLGSNFHESSLEELESLERHTDEIRKALLTGDNASEAIAGGVLIGTCNRFEVYLDTENFHAAVDDTISVVSKVSGLDRDYCSKMLHVSYGTAVAQHLYSVASGLESMIVGEAEISGQVKRSLQDAQADSHASASLQRLFQTASAVAKQVSNQTGLGVAGRSIISTALDLHKAKRGSIEGKRTLVMGTGAYARVIVAALQRAGCQNIWVYSSSGRAQVFSENHGTHWVEPQDLEEQLIRADLVVTASGNKGYSLDFKLMQGVIEKRTALLPIIDVSLAASAAPPVYELPNLEIMDLDYIRLHAPMEHSEAILKAQDLVKAAVTDFESKETARSVDPMIAALRAHVGIWVEEEVDRVRKKSGEEAADEVAKSLNRVTNALRH